MSRFWPGQAAGHQTLPTTLDEKLVPTTCWIGKQDCGMFARVVNGRVVQFVGRPSHPQAERIKMGTLCTEYVDPSKPEASHPSRFVPHPRNLGTLCPKGRAQIIALYDPNRVKTPLIRTNEKGVPGSFREASWEEALTLVGEKIREVKAKDPRLLIWQKGRSKAEAFYDEAFVKASEATKLTHGPYCSDAGYRACEYTIGFHGVLHPDFQYCRYLLAWGWNITEAGGNKLCWITWPRQLILAREQQGMKVVAIDPRLRGVGPFADEWLPIKPGTDLALALALCNALIEQGTIDQEYLKKYTNAPFLVKEDGYFLRIEGKEQVWDEANGSAKPYDAVGISPVLEGEFTVDDIKVKPAFQVFKEHVAKYTPSWAARVCDLPAETIRRIAQELGQNAMIGSTIVLDSIMLPYRPVGAMAYHMSQQELGFQAIRAILIVFMLLGAVEAVGGLRSDFDRKVHKNFKALDEIKIKDPPYNIYLKDSKYFPINSANPSIVAKVMLDPQKYGVDYVPELLIVHMANPIVSFVDQPLLMEAYKKFRFVVVIDPWLSKTADLFADVVLPAATIEKYEGPLNVTDQYYYATTLRLPPIEPLFNSRGEIDIYLDLCEKAEILYGEGGYLDQLNRALKLKDPYKLDLTQKPTVREIFDRWARSEGFPQGIEYFEKRGVSVKPIPVKELYAPAWDPAYGGIRHRLYGESLLRYRDEMKAKGADEIYWRDYTPLPTWRTPTMESSPPEYDLYLISFKKIEFKQSRSSFIPLLAELAPQQYLVINPKTARAKGINDGDEVWVESHNAVTRETRRLRVRARYSEGIRPDTVGMPHHYGEVARHPWAKGQGPTPNALYFTGEGYVTNTQDQAFQVKVRVYK